MRRQITKLDFFWLHRKILVCAEQNKRQKKGTLAMPTFPQKKEIRNVDKMYVPLKKKVFLSILTALPDVKSRRLPRTLLCEAFLKPLPAISYATRKKDN